MEHWVSFPGLGLDHLPIDPLLAQFSLFGVPISITFYGTLIAIGFLLAVIYGWVRAPKVGIDRDAMIDVVLVTTVVAILCARLYYVIFYDLSYYLSHPSKILAIWDGGLGIYGGIIGAFVVGFFMCRARKVPVLSMFDVTAVGFLIGQGIGRWGNFFNQEAYGGNTTLPWGMTGDIIQSGIHGDVADPMATVHPTFLYESLWCLLGALLLHICFVKLYKFRGQIFASYLIWYGSGRLLIEGLRSDSLMIGPFRVSQLVAVLAILVGIGVILWGRKHTLITEEVQQDANDSSDPEEEETNHGNDH